MNAGGSPPAFFGCDGECATCMWAARKTKREEWVFGYAETPPLPYGYAVS